jgi:copper chaperone
MPAAMLRAMPALGDDQGDAMYQFNVPDMTCGHCVSTVTKAIEDADPKAKVDISLAERRVQIQTTLSSEEAARQIAQAAYTPEAVKS